MVVAWLQWRFLVRIYARAQIAIETLGRELGEVESEEDALPTSLMNLRISTVCAWRGSPAAKPSGRWSYAQTPGSVSSGSSATANACQPRPGERCMGVFTAALGRLPVTQGQGRLAPTQAD